MTKLLSNICLSDVHRTTLYEAAPCQATLKVYGVRPDRRVVRGFPRAPESSITSKMPGEVARPVSAARKGCARSPELHARASAVSRTAPSVVAALHSASPARRGISASSWARPPFASNDSAFASSGRGREANRNLAPSRIRSIFGARLEAGHRGQQFGAHFLSSNIAANGPFRQIGQGGERAPPGIHRRSSRACSGRSCFRA